MTEFRSTRIIRNQLHKYLDGFYKLIPFSLIRCALQHDGSVATHLLCVSASSLRANWIF